MGRAIRALVFWCRGGARMIPRAVCVYEDLLRLDSRRAAVSLAEIPQKLQQIRMPLRAQKWERSFGGPSGQGILRLPPKRYN